MAIVVSDLHCNYAKVEKFLNFMPEEDHVFAGDVLDSFYYSFESASKSLNLLLESSCTLIWGNHDIGYADLKNKPFSCSGFQSSDAHLFEAILKPNKNRFIFADCRDGYLITHAGVADYLAKEDTAELEAEYLNSCPEGIFNIGSARGGYHKIGGPLWFDFRYEEYLSDKYNQVFGHCCLDTPMEDKTNTYHHICINTSEDGPDLWAFNTKTKEVCKIE